MAAVETCNDPQLLTQTSPPGATCSTELGANVNGEQVAIATVQNLGFISGFLLTTSTPTAGGFIQLIKECDNRTALDPSFGPALETFVWTWSNAPNLSEVPTGCHQLSNGEQILIVDGTIRQPGTNSGTGVEDKPWVDARIYCDPAQEPTNVNYVLYVVAGFHVSGSTGLPACGPLRSPTIPFGYYVCFVV